MCNRYWNWLAKDKPNDIIYIISKMTRIITRIVYIVKGEVMSSRLIHYLIAEEIASEKKQIDRDRFVYGALLPDLSLHEDGSYDRAHYGEKLTETKMKGINWHKFRSKYYHQMGCDSLYLGYYCHLIMDALWFSKIADKYIRIHPYPERKVYYQKSYDDYKILNYLLSREYDLRYHIPTIDNIEIDEVNLALHDPFFEELKKDIMYSDVTDKTRLKLYTYKAIIDFLEQAKDLCISELNAFEIGKEFMNPQILYTTEE